MTKTKQLLDISNLENINLLKNITFAQKSNREQMDQVYKLK